jgi:methyl-accepting chemotaxis protein
MAQGPSVQRIAFHRSLLGRSMLFGVLPSALVLLAVVAINGNRAWTRSAKSIDSELRHSATQVIDKLEVMNQRNVRLVQLMATAQESGQFGRRAESLRWMERVMRDNPQVYGASIAYEPNADGNDAAGATNGVSADALGPGGRMYAYLKRDPKAPGGLRLEPLQETEEDEELWYGFPKARFERSGVRDPVITKPYTYLGTDIIENIVPIVIDGRFAGITGLDIALTEVQSTLEAEARHLGADLFLTTRGLFIAATTDGAGATSLRTTRVAESPLAAVFAEAQSRRGDSWSADDPMLREECLYISATVPTGEWTLVVRKPTRALFEGVFELIVANLRTAAIGIAVLVALLWAGARAIAQRVGGAQTIAGRISQGDLTSEAVDVRGSDETAELVRAMQTMNSDLANLVSSVRGASARLAASSAQLGATSREQRATVGAFGESTAQIAAAIREISATGSELLRTIEAVDAGARGTAASAAAGRERLGAVSGAMQRLDAGAREVSDRLEAIAEKAGAISAVVTAIAKVAEQTNLLSVNAAIEAEKAGDAGFGFVVVAREIRRLADQTATASHDIARIVGQMQSSVAKGVEEMQRFAGDMKQGTGDVQQIAAELGGIIGAMDHAFARFATVRDGMSSQSAGVAQIEGAVSHVAGGAQQSAAAAVELNRVADELAHSVAVLQDAVARFRLRDAEPGPDAAAEAR